MRTMPVYTCVYSRDHEWTRCSFYRSNSRVSGPLHCPHRADWRTPQTASTSGWGCCNTPVELVLPSRYHPVIIRLSSGYHPVIIPLSSRYHPVIILLSSQDPQNMNSKSRVLWKLTVTAVTIIQVPVWLITFNHREYIDTDHYILILYNELMRWGRCLKVFPWFR